MSIERGTQGVSIGLRSGFQKLIIEKLYIGKVGFGFFYRFAILFIVGNTPDIRLSCEGEDECTNNGISVDLSSSSYNNVLHTFGFYVSMNFFW